VASIFGFIIHPMEIGLIWLAVLVGSAGVGIILFTIFVRFVLSPLQIVQLRNAKAMQRIQPLVKELQQKHGKDRESLTKATMELYREHKVNPAMGCLPMLVQFPILIGLFYALLHLGSSPTGYASKTGINWVKSTCNGHTFPAHGAQNFSHWLQWCYSVAGGVSTPSHVFNLFHANFLWLNHGLGQPDPLYILPVLAGVTQWIQSRMMLTRSNDPQQQMMNQMMNFMPLMIVVFALRYASGLSLYWVTSTLIGILIQYRITGWGLLPSTLASILGPRPAPGSRARSPARSAKTPGSRAASPRPAGSRPPTQAPAVEDNQTSIAESDLNGRDGSAQGAPKPRPQRTDARPRKRANRASRGGRGGGRRG
jgi:YidC/Oxa1 family membrane protein insertase